MQIYSANRKENEEHIYLPSGLSDFCSSMVAVWGMQGTVSLEGLQATCSGRCCGAEGGHQDWISSWQLLASLERVIECLPVQDMTVQAGDRGAEEMLARRRHKYCSDDESCSPRKGRARLHDYMHGSGRAALTAALG